MTEIKNYYKIMEIRPYASQDEIKQSFRRLARKFHPDVSQEPEAERRFKEVHEAYEILKDPEKRTLYNQSQKILKPYTSQWFYLKVNDWLQLFTHIKFKRVAAPKVSLPPDKKRRILFIAGGVAVILSIVVTGWLLLTANNDDHISTVISPVLPPKPVNTKIVSEWQALATALLNGSAAAVEKFENLDSNTQYAIIRNLDIKTALVNFYITHASREVVTKLEALHSATQSDIFQNATVQTLLLTHYQRVIDEEVSRDNLNGALQLLKTIQAHYPQAQDLMDESIKIETIRTKRVAELTEQYRDCLARSPLIENIPCIKEVRRRVVYIDSNSPVLSDPKLPATLAKAVTRALTEKEYTQAEKLLADWQALLPDSDSQRDTLKATLVHNRQVDDIVTNLTSGDKVKVATMLSHLETVSDAVRTDVLRKPKTKEILLNYHFDKIATLMQLSADKVPVLIDNVRKSGRLSQNSKDTTAAVKPPPVQSPTVVSASPDGIVPVTAVSKNKITAQLRECKRHYQENRLTNGPNTALNCYLSVLKYDPNNAEAVAGLQELERSLQTLAEKALKNTKAVVVKNHPAISEKSNANLMTAVQLTQNMKQSSTASPKSPPVEKVIPLPPEPKSASPAPKVRKYPVPSETETLPAAATVAPDSEVPSPAIIESPVTLSPESQVKSLPVACDGCQCSDLFRQISMGVKPLTDVQKHFFQTACR